MKNLSKSGEGAIFEGDGEWGWRDRTHDLVGDVVPHISLPFRLPLRVLGDHELQVWVRGARLARNPAGFHLDEVRLEEADLVLAVHARRIGVLAHHREVVVHLAAVDGCLGLWDQPIPRKGLGIMIMIDLFIGSQGGGRRRRRLVYSVRRMF